MVEYSENTPQKTPEERRQEYIEIATDLQDALAVIPKDAYDKPFGPDYYAMFEERFGFSPRNTGKVEKHLEEINSWFKPLFQENYSPEAQVRAIRNRDEEVFYEKWGIGRENGGYETSVHAENAWAWEIRTGRPFTIPDYVKDAEWIHDCSEAKKNGQPPPPPPWKYPTGKLYALNLTTPEESIPSETGASLPGVYFFGTRVPPKNNKINTSYFCDAGILPPEAKACQNYDMPAPADPSSPLPPADPSKDNNPKR